MEYITHHTHTPAGREGGGEREIKVILVILLMFVYLSSVCVVKSCLKTGSNTKHTASVQGALEKHTDKHSDISVPPSCSLIFHYPFFSILQNAPYNYSTNLPNFSEFCQYLCSEFSKTTGKSVYLKAMT